MARICLVHWNPEEARAHAATLRKLGHVVIPEPVTDTAAFTRLRERPPDAFVICLDRMPSHGRQVAGYLRDSKGTRDIPIVFVGGLPDQVSRVKATLPKTHFSPWKGVGAAIRKAMANPPSLSAMQDARVAGYSGTPLPKKLGIKAASSVALMGAPAKFPETLGELPEGVTLHANPRGKRELTIWFVRTLKELRAAMPRMVAASKQGGVWIAWPKKTSALASDVSETEVRALGLAEGLVDHKICAIDQTWSGLRFARRKSKGS